MSGLSHLEQVKHLIDGGASFLQLRDKTATPAAFYESAVAVIQYARPLGVRVIINDRVDIALAARADGVHLGQHDLPPDEARKLLGNNAIIGFSTHTLEQAIEAVKLPVDYIAFGPTFPTGTKENPDKVVGLELLSKVRLIISKMPLVAIGGINSNNLSSVLATGADSAAVISDLYTSRSDICSNMRKLNEMAARVTNNLQHS